MFLLARIWIPESDNIHQDSNLQPETLTIVSLQIDWFFVQLNFLEFNY